MTAQTKNKKNKPAGRRRYIRRQREGGGKGKGNGNGDGDSGGNGDGESTTDLISGVVG
jgi:hypothetical protein